MSTFVVQTTNFEGPIELLLELVKKRKLSVSELSLAYICDDYIDFVAKIAPHLKPKALSQFLVIASTLLLIKARSLLPQIPTFEEETGSPLLDKALKYQKLEEILKPFLNADELKLVFEKSFLEEINQEEKTDIDLKDIVNYLENVQIKKNQFKQVVKNFKKFGLSSQIKLEKAIKILENKILLLENREAEITDFIKELAFELVEEDDTIEKKRDAGIAGFLSVLEMLKIEKIILIEENGSRKILSLNNSASRV